MAQEWFVKRRDGIDGPFTAIEIRQQAGDGRLLPGSRISRDRQRWVRAGQLKGLEFGNGDRHPPGMRARSGESLERDTSLIHYLIVLTRIPVGLILSVAVTLFFLGWLVIETGIILLTFPFAAIVANSVWIKDSWMGRYPNSLRSFVGGRFKPVHLIWSWATDSEQSIELETEPVPDTLNDILAGRNPGIVGDPSAPEGSPPEAGLGCFGCAATSLLLLALIGALIFYFTDWLDQLRQWQGLRSFWRSLTGHLGPGI